MPDDRSQTDKFKELSRELGADEPRWGDRVRKVAEAKMPAPEKPE